MSKSFHYRKVHSTPRNDFVITLSHFHLQAIKRPRNVFVINSFTLSHFHTFTCNQWERWKHICVTNFHIFILSHFHLQAMRTPRNIFVINLAISDLLLCSFTIPFTLADSLTAFWELGPEMVSEEFLDLGSFISFLIFGQIWWNLVKLTNRNDARVASVVNWVVDLSCQC